MVDAATTINVLMSVRNRVPTRKLPDNNTKFHRPVS